MTAGPGWKVKVGSKSQAMQRQRWSYVVESEIEIGLGNENGGEGWRCVRPDHMDWVGQRWEVGALEEGT